MQQFKPTTDRQRRAAKYNFIHKRLASLLDITLNGLPCVSYETRVCFSNLRDSIEACIAAIQRDHKTAAWRDNPETYPMGKQKENF